ncbi:MAG: hypothetical protein LBS74_05975 [Oscillospiraceae bacterium]|jgi:uncharacterized membrane protein YesL|nr:hypothetical protein [Oscillospiraceae bacterium]
MPSFKLGGNYNKPGKGIDKNAPPKSRIVVFVERFIEKFWLLVGLNIFFAIIAMALGAAFLFIYSKTGQLQLSLIILIPLTIPLCGVTLITRKVTQDATVFLFADFKDAIKKNWMQALILGILDYIFIAVISVALPFVWDKAKDNTIFFVLVMLVLSLCLLFLFIQFYCYLMTVTFDLKIKDILKNSLIFSIANFGKNLIMAIAVIFSGFLILYGLELVETPIFGGVMIVFLVLIYFSGFSFINNFAVWPKIEELLIAPQEAEKKKAEAAKKKPDEKAEANEPEYVFENGRMVKKSSSNKGV